jgi:rod shape-determining protein MreD
VTGIAWPAVAAQIRLLTPGVLTFLAAMAIVIPTGVPGFAEVTPAFTLMAVYHWAIYRPELLPAVAVFGVGVFQDVLTGAPFGLSALVLVAVYWLVASQRRALIGKTFPVEWSGFAVVAFSAAPVTWIAASIYVGGVIDMRPLIVQTGLTIAFYPVVIWIFAKVARSALRPV